VSNGSSLVILTEVEKRLASLETVTEATDMIAQLEAIRTLAQNARMDVTDINKVVALSVRTKKRAGELLRDTPKKKPGPAGKISASVAPISLKELLGTKTEDEAKHLSARWQLLATLTDAQISAVAKLFNDNGLELTTAACYAAARGDAPVTEARETTAVEDEAGAQKDFERGLDKLVNAKDKGGKVGPKLAAARQLVGLFRSAAKEAA